MVVVRELGGDGGAGCFWRAGPDPGPRVCAGRRRTPTASDEAAATESFLPMAAAAGDKQLPTAGVHQVSFPRRGFGGWFKREREATNRAFLLSTLFLPCLLPPAAMSNDIAMTERSSSFSDKSWSRGSGAGAHNKPMLRFHTPRSTSHCLCCAGLAAAAYGAGARRGRRLGLACVIVWDASRRVCGTRAEQHCPPRLGKINHQGQHHQRCADGGASGASAGIPARQPCTQHSSPPYTQSYCESSRRRTGLSRLRLLQVLSNDPTPISPVSRPLHHHKDGAPAQQRTPGSNVDIDELIASVGQKNYVYFNWLTYCKEAGNAAAKEVRLGFLPLQAQRVVPRLKVPLLCPPLNLLITCMPQSMLAHLTSVSRMGKGRRVLFHHPLTFVASSVWVGLQTGIHQPIGSG